MPLTKVRPHYYRNKERIGARIRYMGTKGELAYPVAEIVATLPPGPCLDLFAGICTVATAIAPSGRTVWCNDIQSYATLVAKALLTSQEMPPSIQDTEDLLAPFFEQNQNALQDRFSDALNAEIQALEGKYTGYKAVVEEWHFIGNSIPLAHEASKLRVDPRAFPYRLCTLTFSHGYFGLKQSLDIDSIRYSIDKALQGGYISEERARWYLLALLQTTSRIVSSPGHYAQFLKVKDEKTFKRIRAARIRDVWTIFLLEINRLAPVGMRSWREKSLVFQQNANELLIALAKAGPTPAIVFADPPYTTDHYSRYYHVLETLVLYDYPEAKGVGRYRPDRFSSPFSLVSTIKDAFRSLVDLTANLGAVLVLTYPTNGLLYKVGGNPVKEMKRRFSTVSVATITSEHSTMGASTGGATTPVSEQIIVGQV